MPASTVRLSAGRLSLSDEAQALCFLAGANSIFLGDRLLTTPNPGVDHDQRLLQKLGLHLTEQWDSGLGIRDLKSQSLASNPQPRITNPTSPHGDG
jgi:biotin synthase